MWLANLIRHVVAWRLLSASPLWALLFLLLVGSAPSSLLAQGGSISGQVVQPSPPVGTGGPAAFALVLVCPYVGGSGNPCSPTTPLFADPGLTSPVSNPYTTDAFGNYSVFAATADYIVQVTPVAGTVYSYLILASGGTMTSLSITFPSTLLSSTGCTGITSVGNCVVTLASQSANLIFASPNGSSGTPIWRNVAGPDFGVQVANRVFGNCTTSSTFPSFCSLTAAMIPTTLAGTTFTGNVAIQGSLAVPTVDGTIYVDGNVYPLTSTGIQAAINACQTTNGCTAVDARQVQGINLGTLTFGYAGAPPTGKAIRFLIGCVANCTFTGIVMYTPSIIEGMAEQSWLQYTPGSGNAVTLAWPNPVVPGGGMVNVRIYGASTFLNQLPTEGISLAAYSGDLDAYFQNIEVDGFGTGVSLDNTYSNTPASFTTFNHSFLYGNGRNLNIPSTVASLEAFSFNDSSILNSYIWSNCAYINSAADFRFLGGSLDYCQLVVNSSNAHVRLLGTHSENSTAIAAGGTPFVLTSGTLECTNCDLVYFQTGTNVNYIVNNGGDLHINGGKMFTSGGTIATTPVVTATAGNNWILNGPTVVSWYEMYGGSGASLLNPGIETNGGISNIQGQASAADMFAASFQNQAAGGASWQLNLGATGSTACGAGNVGWWTGSVCPFATTSLGIVLHPNLFGALPACSASTVGEMDMVTNSSTATYNATVTGGGSNVIIAFCNGTNWTAH